MKKIFLLFIGVVISMGFALAQNDTLYFMKDGSVINKQSIVTADLDSIIFVNPVKAGPTVTFKLNFYNDVPEPDRGVYSEGATDIRVKDAEGTTSISVPKGTILGDIEDIYLLPTTAYHFSSYLREEVPYEFGGWTTDSLTVDDPIDIASFSLPRIGL